MNCRPRRASSVATARQCSSRAYPVLADDRVRWVGDPVAFVVAETQAQAADAAEMIAVDYEEPLPAVDIHRQRQLSLVRRRSGTVAPDNISFVELIGDKAATDAAFAKRRAHSEAPLRHQPRDRRHDGAARRGRRLHAGGRPLHHSLAGAARASLSQRTGEKVLKVAGEQSPRSSPAIPAAASA